MSSEKTEIILEAAQRVFEKYGYQKTSMDDIARDAMIGKGTIYNYFNTKEDLFIAILKKDHNEIYGDIKQKIEKTDAFEEKLKLFFIEPCKHFLSHYKLVISVMSEDSPAFLQKVNEYKNEVDKFLKNELLKIFEDGINHDIINKKYKHSIKVLVEIFSKWFMISGNEIKINMTEETVKGIISDFNILIDIMINGLIHKEEKA